MGLDQGTLSPRGSVPSRRRIRMKARRFWYVAALSGAVALPLSAQEFADLQDDHWARDTVMTLAREGILIGDPNGTFRPDASVTRGEIATMLMRALEGSGVQPGNTFQADQERARQMGLLQEGMHANQPATRAEVAHMAVRALEGRGVAMPERDGATFTDVPDAHWAQQDIARARALGLLQGYPDGTFQPERSVTRAEAAMIVSRVRTMAPSARPEPEAGPLTPATPAPTPEPAPPVEVPPQPPTELPAPGPPDAELPVTAPTTPPPDDFTPPSTAQLPPPDPFLNGRDTADVAEARERALGRRPGPGTVSHNFIGQTGNLVTPSALTVPRGELTAGYHYMDKRIFGRGENTNVFSANYGFTSRLEAGFSTLSRDGSKWLVNGKWLVVTEAAGRPAVSIGVVDLFDTLNRDPGAYVVVGKNLSTLFGRVAEETEGRPLRAYLGVGSGSYDGLFGGLNYMATPQLALMAEYAPEGPITGRRDSVNIGGRFAVTDRIQLEAGLFDWDNVGVGVSIRTGLPFRF
jgi:hypothetical protein